MNTIDQSTDDDLASLQAEIVASLRDVRVCADLARSKGDRTSFDELASLEESLVADGFELGLNSLMMMPASGHA